MSSRRICSLLAFLLTAVHGAGNYADRPLIRAENGDLIIQPSDGRSVYIRTRGRNSKIYAGDVDLTALRDNVTVAAPQSAGDVADVVSTFITGPGNILSRLSRLENRIALSNSSFGIGPFVRVRLALLSRQVETLQTQMNQIHTSVSNCASNQCKNGGTCLPAMVLGGYFCICPTNWEGSNCDVDVNECRNFAGTDLGCQNGAACINRQGTYECLCTSGWFGVHCTRRSRDCSGGDAEICGHGSCIHTQSGSGVKCLCDQGWTNNGTDQPCVVDVDECSGRVATCSINPPVSCINTPGAFSCGACPAGYSGDGFRCYDIDECVIDNGGCSKEPHVSCHNTVGSRVCGACPAGYQGDGVTCEWRGSCGINRGGCHPSARCIENIIIGPQFVQCVCPQGMSGDGVGIGGCYLSSQGSNATDCIGNPCGNYGQCRRLEKGITCICDSTYTGPYCDRLKDVCTDQPCKNGGICKTDNTTVGYSCECTALYSGENCQNRARSCNAILESQEGTIMYPLPNSSLIYNHNSRCFWIIRVQENKVINVTFTKFNLEFSSPCYYDFLQIHDAPNAGSNLIGRFCGTDFPKGGNIISSHNSMYFWFRSDSSVSKEGFALHWAAIEPVCGGDVDANIHGSISSPGWPGHYPPNRDCYWHLTTDPGKKIQLHFFKVSLETHPNCSFDYLSIYAGGQNTDPLISKYCNTTLPAPIQSTSSEMLIHFHSDEFSNDEGFQISYNPITGCGGRYTSNRAEITPPTYNGKYENDVTCDYEIQVTPGNRIKLKFLSFNLESSRRCRFDYLSIYDGPSSASNLIGKFCGRTLPAAILSASNSIFMRFKSDSTFSAEGFRIEYEVFCKKIFTEDSGILFSPGYPHQYSINSACDFIISTMPGKVIKLSFLHFDLENGFNDCDFDNLKVIDGPNDNSSVLGTYCGSNIPPDIISTHNYLLLRLTTDHSISGTGFEANYTTLEIGCGGIYTANTGIISHPKNDGTYYENDQDCTWIIMAPVDQNVRISWTRFNLEQIRSSSCSADYVRIIDENIEQGSFCGSRLPPALTSISNKVVIKFHSDETVRSFFGFSLTYSMSDTKQVCGGNYLMPHGYIRSPGWPDNYLFYKDCIWTITVPTGQQIFLNVSKFELELSRSCSDDFLEIRNGPTEESPLIGKFCGNNIPRRFSSHSNTLYLHFHSDAYLQYKGFNIEWDGSSTGCGGTLTSSSGVISSPNYPQPYGENAECFWKVTVSAGSVIRIAILNVEMEQRSECFADYLEFYDGKDATAPVLARLCSHDPRTSSLVSSSNQVFIKFRSDYDLGGKGFYLNYYTDCRNVVTGFSGVIESPDFPNDYPNNLDCLWTIEVPKGNTINASFSHFDIPKTRNFYRPRSRLYVYAANYILNCRSEYVQIKDGVDNNFGDKICGSEIPSAVVTRDNKLYIKLVTGPYLRKSGFRLEWKADGCGGSIQKTSGTIELPKHKKGRTDPLECLWVIETDPGKSVKLMIYNVDMIDSPNCTLDSIEVYNGDSVSSPLITKLCQRQSNSYHVISTANTMVIKYSTTSQYSGSGFRANFISSTAVCGGSIVANSGTFFSPNYPKNYNKNSNCVWYIVVPDGHRIHLDLIDMDLYSSIFNKCNSYIEIFDFFVNSNNYTKKYCGDLNEVSVSTRSFTSKSNTLKVKFTSGDEVSKGFMANFSAICGSVIRGKQTGILNIENAISSNEVNCTWTILADNPEQKVSLTLTHMHLSAWSNTSSTRSCPRDFLRLLDGNDIEAPVVGEYCGKKIPPTFVSHGSALTVQLGTYVDRITGQFTARYSLLDTFCGGTLTSEEGTLASPGYPDSYSISTDCVWNIVASPGNKVTLTFEKFSLERSVNCNEDYVEIRDGDSSGKLIAAYCGGEVPSGAATATQLYVKFHSDNSSSAPGFLAHYSYIFCNEILNLSSGIVSSPLYPHDYRGAGQFSWRITTETNSYITLTIAHLQIDSRGSYCNNYLVFFDGYDETAPVIKKICGFLQFSEKELTSTSNMIYVKLFVDDSNIRSSFTFDWLAVNRNRIVDLIDTNKKCNINSTIDVSKSVTIISPNYPSNYDDESHCQWIFTTTLGRHLKLKFTTFELEEDEDCDFDYVKVYSGLQGVNDWRQISGPLCLSSTTTLSFEATMLMKVEFISDVSGTAKGFFGSVYSVCGGILTQPSGIIEVHDNDTIPIQSITNCNWTVTVKPFRTIKVTFERFHIPSTGSSCRSFVSLRNGASIQSPPLGKNKYCGETIPDVSQIETIGNTMFVTYLGNAEMLPINGFRLKYEEKSRDCGGSIRLDDIMTSQVIQTLNYPEPPLPYSECTWTIIAPPGEILRLDFVERFDLAHKSNSEECTDEYVEIKDGATAISRLIGRYCNEKHLKSVKTTGNFMFVKFVTVLAAPSDGFKANISINVCGGMLRSSYGIVTSPGYPKYPNLPVGTVCEWRLISSSSGSMWINFTDIDFPESTHNNYNVRIEVEDVISTNKSKVVSKIVRNRDETPYRTITNEVILRFFYENPHFDIDSSRYRGFKINFNSTNNRCGGPINYPSGYIESPGYPQVIGFTRFCSWRIKIPDASRRIRLEFLDIGSTDYTINLYNDLNYRSILSENVFSNWSETNNVFESTGNTMTIVALFMRNSQGRRGFRARFTSDQPAICGGKSSAESGILTSQSLIDVQTYYCLWRILPNFNSDLKFPGILNKTIYLRINATSNAWKSSYCSSYGTVIVTTVNELDYYNLDSIRDKCTNGVDEYRIPFQGVYVNINKLRNDSLHFNIEWRLQPCGGRVDISDRDGDILNLPNSSNVNGSLDCAWIVIIPPGRHVELQLTGSFSLSCSQEDLQITQGTAQNSPVIANYCQGTAVTRFRLNYESFNIQYHSDAYSNATTIKLNTITENSKFCGGTLTRPNQILMTPNYPKEYKENEECTWDISTSEGNKIALSFDGRFYIEDTVNCSKDFVSVMDWKNNQFTEIHKFCGRDRPEKHINSTSNRMKVVFKSDSNINADGFLARWEVVCGGDYIATENEQFIYSPNYPELYSNNLDCLYKVQATDKSVLVRFDSFSVERGFNGLCNNDNLTLNALYSSKIDTYCGNNIPPMKSYSEAVEIRFRTDSSISRNGFKIAYKLKTCGGNITNHTTIFSSAEERQKYEDNVNCIWNITAPVDKNVVIRFERFDLEDTHDCFADNVAVYDGAETDEERRLALLCGRLSKNLPVLRSSGRNMVVQFSTDMSLSYGGFKAQVYFSYGEAIGCGGRVNLSNIAQQKNISSPILPGAFVYEKYLDCHWVIETLRNNIIELKFNRFNIAPCTDLNQTAIGYSNCTCDAVHVYDGANTISRLITTFCGHNIPPTIMSSSNFMTIVLHTDGETESAGFQAQLREIEMPCGARELRPSSAVQHIKSPGYAEGRLPRGVLCTYHIVVPIWQRIRLRVNNLDLEPASSDTNRCSRDRLDISSYNSYQNASFGKNVIIQGNSLLRKYRSTFIHQEDKSVHTLCGRESSLDLTLKRSVTITLQTSADEPASAHRGFDIEVSSGSGCGSNYTGLQGRIEQLHAVRSPDSTQCISLIEAPLNFTISVYFYLFELYSYYQRDMNLEILDGNRLDSKLLTRIEPDTSGYSAAFSTGRHMLIRWSEGTYRGEYILNYMATDAGRGCGGRLRSAAGVVTSPLYPEPYRAVRACEFQLETLAETRLLLHFQMFDLGSRATCEQVYVQLVDRAGAVQRTYCAGDRPADFDSADNYVKLVYHTTMNTGGAGWVVEFVELPY